MRRNYFNSRRLRGRVRANSPADAILGLSPFAAYRGSVTNTASSFDWTDRTGHGHTLRQSTAGSKPSIVTPTEFASKPALRFDGVDDYLISTEAASVWKFLHAGPCTILAVELTRQVGNNFQIMLSTSDGGTGATGLGTVIGQYEASPGPLNVLMNCTGAGRTINDQASVGAAQGVPQVRVIRHADTGGSPEWRNQKVVTPSSTTTGGSGTYSPSSADPTYTLNVGRRGDGGGSFGQFDIAELVFFDRYLPDADVTSALATFTTLYGLPG